MRQLVVVVVVVVSLGFVAACGDDPVHKLPDGPAVAIDAAVDAAVDAPSDSPPPPCKATFDPGTGPVDVEAAVTGTAAAPAVYTPPGAGKLVFCPATYFVHLTATANLEVAGATAATTILDGGMSGSVITSITAGVTLKVHDLTVTHGAAASGAGIDCASGTIDMKNAVVANNTATANGGGIFLGPCPATITDTTITANQAVNGGGLWNQMTTATLTRVTVTNNTATNAGGGLVNVDAGAKLDLVDSLVNGNTSTTQDGGGVYNEDAVSCTTTTITANTGYGVLLVDVGATFTSTACDFGTDAATDNTPHDVDAANGGTGGAVDYGAAATFSCTNSACN